MDIVASAWVRGNDSNAGDADPRTHRTMKTVRPTSLISGDTVHFLWQLPGEPMREEHGYVEVLVGLARSVVALGWGVDMVAASAAVLSDEQSNKLHGERWLPSVRGNGGWRVPVHGTLDALIDRHRRFLGRLGDDGRFIAPPPLTRFKVVGYRRSDDPAERAVAAFALRDLETSNYRAFDSARRGLTVAGRMRHATYKVAKATSPCDWSESQLVAFVLGHGEPDGAPHVPAGARRFAYMPLPSIESLGRGRERVGAIRRVLLSTFAEGCASEIAWAQRALSGEELIDEHTNKATACLEAIATKERTVQRYLDAADSWASVTPVVLPGYDDPRHYRRRLQKAPPPDEQKELLTRLSERIDGLVRKAIVQAGFPNVLAEHAVVDWRKVGYWPGVDLADRYGVPDHLKRFPRYHVRITWRNPAGQPVRVPGPVCIGGGRFMGLGLFASL
jgi:CRISPR-associated protein Csb2